MALERDDHGCVVAGALVLAWHTVDGAGAGAGLEGL